MPRDVYETLENNGDGVVSEWDLPSEIRAKLEQKLHMLPAAEVDKSGKVNLPFGLIAGPGVWEQEWIYKLKIGGRQAIRPMLCLGPANRESEWTVLARAREQDGDTREQKAAAARAAKRRQEILEDRRICQVLIEAKK